MGHNIRIITAMSVRQIKSMGLCNQRVTGTHALNLEICQHHISSEVTAVSCAPLADKLTNEQHTGALVHNRAVHSC
jgi:hypothetical protein